MGMLEEFNVLSERCHGPCIDGVVLYLAQKVLCREISRDISLQRRLNSAIYSTTPDVPTPLCRSSAA